MATSSHLDGSVVCSVIHSSYSAVLLLDLGTMGSFLSQRDRLIGCISSLTSPASDARGEQGPSEFGGRFSRYGLMSCFPFRVNDEFASGLSLPHFVQTGDWPAAPFAREQRHDARALTQGR